MTVGDSAFISASRKLSWVNDCSWRPPLGKHGATGMSFKLSMVTIGHWRNGVMDEEWLMWDNHAFMRQIGLAPYEEDVASVSRRS